MMKIITTPMCEDVLRISGLKEYEVVKPTEIKDADVAILLSETKSEIPKISIKLNTFRQVYDSIILIEKQFNTTADENEVQSIKHLIDENNQKKDNRKDTKVKVYSNFLKDTVIDMGFTVDYEDYDYIIMPDYMDVDTGNQENVIIVPSHKNVSNDIIGRVKDRYDLLERKLCMKQ